MNYKNILTFFLFFISFTPLWSKWNVILANWIDLSDYKDKSISSMLKSSVYNKLKKDNSFEVKMINDDSIFYNISQAHETCIKEKGDVIIYGFYYVEGKSLFVITEVWDALKKQLKMRSEATGVVGIDIFDTIDEISIKTKEKIKEALPILSLEEETEVQKLRKTIYEKEEIKIERKFYTKIGFNLETGKKNAEINSGDIMLNNTPIPILYPSFGFMLRYWNLRLDFNGGPMPGWLIYNFQKSELTTESPIHYMDLSLSYYLPFFNKQFAIGINAKIVSLPLNIYVNNTTGTTNIDSFDILPSLPFSLKVFWNPNDNLEFSFGINPFVTQSKSETEPNRNIYFRNTSFNIPFITLSGAYFFNNDMGMELEIGFASFSFKTGEIRTDNTTYIYEKGDNNELLNLQLNFIYRVDYSKLGKNEK